MRGQAQAHSSVAKGTQGARDDWRTPAALLDRVRKLGPIGLDPCANGDNSTRAAGTYTGMHAGGSCGLIAPWHVGTRGQLVYANYPYSQSMAWAKKWTTEARTGVPIVILGPARPDTAWHRLAVQSATLFGCWRGRITFELAPGVGIYKVNDPDISGEGLHGEPGVHLVVDKGAYYYVEADRTVMEIFVAAGLIAAEQKPAPAPFPSALFFYNLAATEIAAAFGDVCDLYERYT